VRLLLLTHGRIDRWRARRENLRGVEAASLNAQGRNHAITRQATSLSPLQTAAESPFVGRPGSIRAWEPLALLV
jgi:hypothetical protein